MKAKHVHIRANLAFFICAALAGSSAHATVPFDYTLSASASVTNLKYTLYDLNSFDLFKPSLNTDDLIIKTSVDDSGEYNISPTKPLSQDINITTTSSDGSTSTTVGGAILSTSVYMDQNTPSQGVKDASYSLTNTVNSSQNGVRGTLKTQKEVTGFTETTSREASVITASVKYPQAIAGLYNTANIVVPAKTKVVISGTTISTLLIDSAGASTLSGYVTINDDPSHIIKNAETVSGEIENRISFSFDTPGTEVSADDIFPSGIWDARSIYSGHPNQTLYFTENWQRSYSNTTYKSETVLFGISMHTSATLEYSNTQEITDYMFTPGASVPYVPAIPEPSSLALMGLGLAGIAGIRRAKLKRTHAPA